MNHDTHRAFKRLEDDDVQAASIRAVEPPSFRALGMIAGGSAVIVLEVKDAVLMHNNGRALLNEAVQRAAAIFGMTGATKVSGGDVEIAH